MNQLADINLYPGGGFEGFGLFGLEGSTGATGAGTLFNLFISRAIGVITVVAFVWFLFILVTGAISIMGAGGDKAAAETARKRIFTGLIGLVVLIAGIFLIRLVGAFLGIQNILNPGEIIYQISK